MDGIKYGPDKPELTRADKAKIADIYKDFRDNKLTAEKYIGLQAICYKLGEPHKDLFESVVELGVESIRVGDNVSSDGAK